MSHIYTTFPSSDHVVLEVSGTSNGDGESSGIHIWPAVKPSQVSRWCNTLILALACCLAVTTSGCGSGLNGSIPGAFQVSPGTVDFGNVPVGHLVSSNVALSNDGLITVVISQLNITGRMFSVISSDKLPISIPAGGTHTLKIGFAPGTTADYSGQLTLMDVSAKSIAQIPMHGTGSDNAAPQLTVSARLGFGSVTVNSATTKPLTLTSTGTSPVTVSSAAITGAGFTIIGGSFPVTLNPTQSVTLQLQFQPTTTGATNGQITINSNASDAVVALSGTGTPAEHEVDLTWNAPSGSPDPVVGYNVYRAIGGGSLQLMNSSPNAQTAYVDSTVLSGTNYVYTVHSVGSNGIESSPSNEILVTIP